MTDQLSSEGKVEVIVGTHRGFSIREYAIVRSVFEVDPDYCPDPDTYYSEPIQGYYRLQIDRAFSAVRIRTGELTFHNLFSIEEVKHALNQYLSEVRNPIPF